MKAAAEAGRLKRAPPRVPRRMQNVRAWARVRARGQRGRMTRVAKRQVVACTRAGLEYLGSVYIYLSLSVLLGRTEGGMGGLEYLRLAMAALVRRPMALHLWGCQVRVDVRLPY